MGKPLRSVLVSAGCFILGAAFMLVILAWAVERAGRIVLLQFANTHLSGLIGRSISCSDAGVSLWKRSLHFSGVRVKDPRFFSRDEMLVVDRITVELDIPGPRAAAVSPGRVTVEHPVLTLNADTWGSGTPRRTILERMPAVDLREARISRGELLLRIGTETLPVLTDAMFTADNSFLAGGADRPHVSLRVSGQIPSDRPGSVSLSLRIDEAGPAAEFSGEMHASNIPIAYFYNAFNPVSETTVVAGTLQVRSTIACTNGWLTMANVVTLERLLVRTEQKKLYGIPAEQVTGFFAANDVPFELTVSGPLNSLRFNVSSAASQVLRKALSDRIRDATTLQRVSDSLGRAIGDRLEADIEKLLYPKKRAGDAAER